MNTNDLRFGNVTSFYYEVIQQKMPKQLDLIAYWLPNFVILELDNPHQEKIEAVYDDLNYQIQAVKYHGHFYTGNSKRVSQIVGRLIGTAKGNQEKERKSAELIQRHLASKWITDCEAILFLQEHIISILNTLDNKQLNELYQRLFDYALAYVEAYSEKDEYTKEHELFPLYQETFERLLYNVLYQFKLGTLEGLCNGYLWLIIGSFLRNESSRLLHVYDSSWIAINRIQSEEGDFLSQLDYLLYPEDYDYVYGGEKGNEQFPGIEWYCDACEAHLNEQEGFTDWYSIWQCRKCGYLNNISINEIYDSKEDYHSGQPTDKKKFKKALKK